jgi:glyoxylase-like metal-dependent hydrolase (beta-lactamase superfamily II)
MRVQELFDPATFTLTYVISDPATGDAVVIDSVLDYDPASSTVNEASITKVCALVEGQKLKPHYFLETHPHADHFSGAQVLKARYPGAKVAIGARITEVQKLFKDLFDLPSEFPTDGSQFDRLLQDGETLQAGSLSIGVRHTPGHTPACASYVIGDAVFTGDMIFMPDYGVGRCDFPGASAESLFDSVTGKIYSLPDSTRMFTGHDYLPDGRALRFESSVNEQKKTNLHVNEKTTRDGFVKFRNTRDKTLSAPRLLFPSIQVNIAAGHLPAPRANGRRYLCIPIS